MLARALPGVSSRWAAGATWSAAPSRQRFGRVVHVLDDGFQHLRLARDLDVVCLDARDLSDRPLPAGRLREGPRALARAARRAADAGRGGERGRADGARGPARARAHAPRLAPRARLPRRSTGATAQPPRRAFLLAAIARPERVERDVLGDWRDGRGPRFFRDHHPFRASEVGDAIARARAAGADAVVTTAKDAVRLEGLPAGDLPVLVLEIAAEIEDEPRFRARLLAAVAEDVVTRDDAPRARGGAGRGASRRSCAGCRGAPCSRSAAGSAGSGGGSTRATSRSPPTTCAARSPSGTRRACSAPRAASTRTSGP